MSNNSNQRIIKNSVFLFARTFITTIISLYTSRIFLEQLGVEDYGIYNLVGGIVALFAVIQNLLASSTQRFLNIKMGQNDETGVGKIFNISLSINFIIILIVFLLSETIGLWFLLRYINIPEGKQLVSLIVYQLSIMTTLVSIYRVPYIAFIVAKEEMSIFAYLTIFETIVKLIIALSLTYFENKIIVYSIFLLLVAFVTLCLHIIYCKKRFCIPKYKVYNPKSNNEYKEIISFSLWTLIGNSASVARDQGISVLLNVFYGVVLNATMGIVVQLSNVFSSLFSNIQTAFLPQIVQNKNSVRFSRLVESCSFLTVVIMGYVCVPMILNADYVLKLWLDSNLPSHTVAFTRILMIKILIASYSQAIYQSLMADGHIACSHKSFVILAILTLGATFLGLKCGFSPEMAFLLICVMELIMLALRLYFMNIYTIIKVKELRRSLFLLFIIIISIIPLNNLNHIFESSFSFLITSTFVYIVCQSVVVVLLLTAEEVNKLKTTINKIITCLI